MPEQSTETDRQYDTHKNLSFEQRNRQKIDETAGELLRQVSEVDSTVPAADMFDVLTKPEKAAAVQMGLQKFNFLTETLKALSYAEQDELIIQLLRAEQKQHGTSFVDTLEEVFYGLQGRDLKNHLGKLGVSLSDLPNILSDQVIIDLLSILVTKPEEYRFQLGVILSQLRISALPDSLIDQLKIVLADIPYELKIAHEAWWLCTSSEKRLIEALNDDMVLLLNNCLLVKFYGRLTALCIQTTSFPDGHVLVEGNFYSPIDEQTRQELRNACDAGISRLQLNNSSWALMRSIKNQKEAPPAEEILKIAREYVIHMPNQFPPEFDGESGEMPRNWYRDYKKEDYDREPY